MEKVILISIDGCRPDALQHCGNPFVQELMRRAAFTYTGRTVFPSLTLPCHLSLFYAVPPERHGVRTNTFMPFARPLDGLVELLHAAGYTAAMYTGWDPLRDVARPDSLSWSGYCHSYSAPHTDDLLTDMALARIAESEPDFVFLHLVETDQKGGHDNGWMSRPYLERVSRAVDNVRRVVEAVVGRYSVIVTADHGGHERDHGSELDEDMTIPQFYLGPSFAPGCALGETSILDIAPTIARLMGLRQPREWEGRPLVCSAAAE